MKEGVTDIPSRIPDSIQAVINGRIDALPIPEQMVLKIGSVLGKIFHKAPLESLLLSEGISTTDLDR